MLNYANNEECTMGFYHKAELTGLFMCVDSRRIEAKAAAAGTSAVGNLSALKHQGVIN